MAKTDGRRTQSVGDRGHDSTGNARRRKREWGPPPVGAPVGRTRPRGEPVSANAGRRKLRTLKRRGQKKEKKKEEMERNTWELRDNNSEGACRAPTGTAGRREGERGDLRSDNG